ncbi:MAG: hypothetical protein HYV47_01970 [Candidatus Nealsonbacteria bacterium]|nr:hypothetical protein [Candidatus Nealsonbacteria bacterium]
MASHTYEIPRVSSEIRGNTPLEKTQSLVDYLNKKTAKDFANVSLLDIDYKTSTWYYTVMVHYPVERVFHDQGFQSKYIFLVGELVTKTVGFSFVKKIMIRSMFPDFMADIIEVDESGTVDIRKYPENWMEYVSQRFVGLAPIDLAEPESAPNEENPGKNPGKENK